MKNVKIVKTDLSKIKGGEACPIKAKKMFKVSKPKK